MDITSCHSTKCIWRNQLFDLGVIVNCWVRFNMDTHQNNRETYLVSICPCIRLQRSDSRLTCSVYLDSIMSHLWKGPPTWLFQWLALAKSASIETRTPSFSSSSALTFYASTRHRRQLNATSLTSCQIAFWRIGGYIGELFFTSTLLIQLAKHSYSGYLSEHRVFSTCAIYIKS